MPVQLFDFQQKILDQTKDRNRVAYYLDMGLGKTSVGSEKMMQLGNNVNLLICQKSKIQDWIDHFQKYYSDFPYCTEVFDLTQKRQLDLFLHYAEECQEPMEMWEDMRGEPVDEPYYEKNPDPCQYIGVINYELTFRRPELLKLRHFTLMLDESSLICNEHTKRSKFVLRLQADNVILLSGTPTAGRYERLVSQCWLLGWKISRDVFWNSYVRYHYEDFGGFMHQVVDGYKNVDNLKRHLADLGAVFMKTEEVISLPAQVDQKIMVDQSREYKRYRKTSYLVLPDGTELEGTNTLVRMMHERQLCSGYSKQKLQAFADLVTSTEDNLVVFYWFNIELEVLLQVCSDCGRNAGIVNGQHKDRPDGHDILLVQFQAGSYGLNLQGFSNRIVYYSLPLGIGSCDMWEQSKKRIHRIGQDKTCFYYYLLVRNSVEIWNLKALKEGKDFTDKLFERMEQE